MIMGFKWKPIMVCEQNGDSKGNDSLWLNHITISYITKFYFELVLVRDSPTRKAFNMRCIN